MKALLQGTLPFRTGKELRAARAAVDALPRAVVERRAQARAHVLAADQVQARVVPLADAETEQVVATLRWAAFERAVGAWLVHADVASLTQRLQELEPRDDWSVLIAAASQPWPEAHASDLAESTVASRASSEVQPALQRATAALLEELEEPWRRLAVAVRWRRVWAGLLAAVIIGLASALVWLGDRWLSRGPDVAVGRPWEASSGWNERPVRGSKLADPAGPFFFSTDHELRPWWRIDLGQPRPIEALRLENRSDCCQERAIPLSVAVSLDGEEWREVAKRTKPFSRWLLELEEPVTARFVRLQVERRSLLHLRNVQVFTRE